MIKLASLNDLIVYIPLRLESSRVYRKNFALCNHKPLYTYIFDTIIELIPTKSLKNVYIDYDNSHILDLVDKKYQSYFNFFKRPDSLISESTTIIPLLNHFISKYDLYQNHILQTHVTNPLLSVEVIRSAFNFYCNSDCCPIFSVTEHKKRFFDINNNPLNHKIDGLVETQSLSPLYEENSCIYIFEGNSIVRHQSRTPHGSIPFVTPYLGSIDIDDEFELLLCDSLMKIYK